MAYTTPITFVAAAVLTAAQLNTNLRDNIAWMATDSPTCRVYNSAALSIVSGSSVALTFNSERFDNAAMHSTSTNTGRITIPTGGGGKYLIGCVIEWNAAAGGNYRDNRIRNGGTTFHAGVTVGPIGGAGSPLAAPVGTWNYTAADYAEVVVAQDSGGNININSADGSPEFWAVWTRT
jgi:hypothetical protein